MLTTSLLLAASIIVGQAEGTNVKYEKLKVLMPIIGTWQRTLPMNDKGQTWEVQKTYTWAANQKCIEGEVKFRMANTDQGWGTVMRQFFIWNQKTEQIEMYQINTWGGGAKVEQWIPKGNGVFTVDRISDTREKDKETGDTTATITIEDMTTKTTNRKSADGETLEDEEFVLTRIK